MANTTGRRGAGFWVAQTGSWFIALIGLALLAGGVRLLALGGSSYYFLAGFALVVAGWLLALGRASGGQIYGVTLLATLAWAMRESGATFWPLLPRLFAPAVLGLLVLALLWRLPRDSGRMRGLMLTGLGMLLSLGWLGSALVNQFSLGQAKAPAASAATTAISSQPGDWRYYGRDPGGRRFAPYDQINKANIETLKVAWTLRTGDEAGRGSEDQNTPLQIGDTVYVCTPRNIVIAADADTGKERWRHDPKVKPFFWNRCRGVGYYETPTVAAPTPGPTPALCARRIFSSTINAQLIALDAATGARCPGFGKDGVVDLTTGMGEVKRGFYFQTSTPTVAKDRVIVGGWVMDNRELGEPSGVVRAFSAETGELVWAWDLGNPAITKLPPEGQTYTRGTPNVWSTPAFDPDLGLVYLPTGNATPDYWGSHRSDHADKYASSVVALDIATGKEAWRFQTVHHDLWDYDVPSQPMLADFPIDGGKTAPALIQLTKRGQIFVLDRRTGAPLTRVVERPVPQGAEKGEWTAPTQPYSVDMPTIGADRVTERQMWGVTPLDQLLCRITLRKLRYEGDFTPPGVKPTLQYPGNAGGMNWGSGALDETGGRLIVTDTRMPIKVTLKPAKTPEMALARAADRSAKGKDAIPYESDTDWLVSPLGVPCFQPPNGTMTAVDLATRKIVWQVPLGTAETSGPFGLHSGLPIPIGSFGLGGAITTGSGITFHAATSDPYLRAYDSATGKIIWKARLPVGVGGTPMTYVSPKTGRQYVVVSAGGARQMPSRGDYVIAFALPN
jgi:quinate dehydrogenase (quinone)